MDFGDEYEEEEEEEGGDDFYCNAEEESQDCWEGDYYLQTMVFFGIFYNIQMLITTLIGIFQPLLFFGHKKYKEIEEIYGKST